MTRNASFIRKIIYISVMGVLLLPLSYLSQPSGVNVQKHKGGKLDQLRREYGLSQSSLGEVDPTSETMKLATLGMRGVATTILWHQANEHKKKENWDAFATVLRQISKLQPHFIKVWIFQAWNQSYNVSVEFDDYRYRYHWVKKGISYLIEGTRYNQNAVKLQGELGRVFGHKIGRSDERQQFRRMFREDHDFHAELPINPDDPNVEVRDYEQKIDNWLVGREFCLRAIRTAESPRGSKEWGASPVLFYSEPVMRRMSYAESIVGEGYFGDLAREAWVKSGREWEDYGNRSIRTSQPGLRIQLLGLPTLDKRIAEIDDQLEDIAVKVEELESDLAETIRQEKIEALSDVQREAYEADEEDRTQEQKMIAEQVEKRLEVTPVEIVARAPEEIKKDAARLLVQREDLLARRRFTESYRNIVNYEYWLTRCKAEQQQEMLDAQRLVTEAAELRRQAKPSEHIEFIDGKEVKVPGAKEVYEQAWDKFATVFREYPIMLDNPETEDLLVHVQDYRDMMERFEMPLPENFKMQIILDMYDTVGQRRVNSEELIMQWLAKMDRMDAGVDEEDPRTATPRPPQPIVTASDESDSTPPAGDDGDDAPAADDPRAAEVRPPVVE